MKPDALSFGALALSAIVGNACVSRNIEDSARIEQVVTVDGLRASLSLTSKLDSGYCVAVTLENVGNGAITTWGVEIELGGSTVQTLWNAAVSASGNRLSIRPASYNGTLNVGGKTAFGFCTSGDVLPTIIAVHSAGASSGAGSGGASSSGIANIDNVLTSGTAENT